MFLGEPCEAQVAAAHPPRCKTQAPKPNNAAKLMESATKPQVMQVCLPPPGLESLPPEQDISLIGIPNPDGAQSALMPVSAISMVVYKNEVTGNLQYEYEIHYLRPLCQDSPNHRP